jgi:hypothetical protein
MEHAGAKDEHEPLALASIERSPLKQAGRIHVPSMCRSERGEYDQSYCQFPDFRGEVDIIIGRFPSAIALHFDAESRSGPHVGKRDPALQSCISEPFFHALNRL